MNRRAVRGCLVFVLASLAACSGGSGGKGPEEADAGPLPELGLDAGEPIGTAPDGGGEPVLEPRIEVVPQRLDFVSQPGEARRVTIANTGTAPLRFGSRTADGHWTSSGPELSGDSPDAFAVDWPPAGFDDETGLAPGDVLDVFVHYRADVGARHSATLIIRSNAPESAIVTVSLQAAPRAPCHFEVVPPRIAIGTIEPGRSVTLSVYIVNSSANPADVCVLGSIMLEDSSGRSTALDGAPPPGTVIKGGERLEVSVRLAGSADGPTLARIVVRMENSDKVASVEVRWGVAATNCLRLPNVDFGTVTFGCSVDKVVTLTAYNLCAISAQVDSVVMRGDPAFTLVNPPPMPAIVPAGGSLGLPVRIAMSAPGPHSATLELTVAGQPDPLVANLSVTVPSSRVQVDTFETPVPAKADLLFIVDDTQSMSAWQQAIATNVGALLDRADQLCVDYQVGVTTTAVDASHGGIGSGADLASGRLLPLDGSRPRVVTSSMPDRRQRVLQNLQVGTSGSGPEFLIRPALFAVTNPFVSGHNAGFLRPDAKLEIIAISDASDHDAVALTAYQTVISAGRPSSWGPRFSYSAVVPTSSPAPIGCVYGEADAATSTRARDFASLTSGNVSDICAADWFTPWNRWSDGCPRSTFSLSAQPEDPSNILVSIDGLEYPRVGPSGQVRWSYDPATSSVSFAAASVPEPGSTITVAYHVACP